MFLHLSVSHSVHGGVGVGGVVTQHALQVSRSTPRGGGLGVWPWGECPGPHPGGSPGLPGGMLSQHALRQTPPQQTATAVGGTHPTGCIFVSKVIPSEALAKEVLFLRKSKAEFV